MFGFSFPKIILLLVIIFLIWNFFKFLEKKKNIKEGMDGNIRNDKNMKEEESMVECKKCGNFFSIEFKNKCPVCEK